MTATARAARDQVSVHEARVFVALRDSRPNWLSNSDLAARVPGVSLRTVRGHVARWVETGLVERDDVYPGPKYRLSQDFGAKHRAYVTRLEQAAERFGEKGECVRG